MDKLYILFGMIGAICFLIGDILLGWVDPETVDKRTHSYITEGHGKRYSRSKIAVTMTLAAIGIPFLYLGMVHCSGIATEDAWANCISDSFALTSIAWMCMHAVVSFNVLVFSWLDSNVSREKAIEASEETKKTFSLMMIIVDLIGLAAFMILIVALAKGKTILPKYYIAFSPLVGACVAALIEKLIPQSKLRKTIGTIQLNVGLLLWFISLLFV